MALEMVVSPLRFRPVRLEAICDWQAFMSLCDSLLADGTEFCCEQAMASSREGITT